MTPRKAPLIGSFLFIDPAHGFNFSPGDVDLTTQLAVLLIEMKVIT